MHFKFHPSCAETFYRVESALDCLSFHSTCGNPKLIAHYQGRIDQLIELALRNRRYGYVYIAPGELPYQARRRKQAAAVH